MIDMDVTDAPIVRETGALRNLALAAGVATSTLTGISFWLSYAHLHDVARRYGLDGSRAWAWPSTVDMFIGIGEMLILRAMLRGRGTDTTAVVLTVVGSVGSVALNVAGVGSDAPAMTYVVAAVPPIAALLAFGALMRQVYGVLASVASPAMEEPATAVRGVAPPAPNETGAVAPPAPRRSVASPAVAGVSLAKAAPRAEAPAVSPAKAPRAAAQSTADKRAQEAADRRRARDLIEALYDVHGRRPRDSEMTAALKDAGLPCSRQYAGARRTEIERAKPALAALGQRNVRALGQPPPGEHRRAL